jgi:hypothetical protein
VIVPVIGVFAGVGAAFRAADVVAVEVQPPAFVTVNVYVVPAVNPAKVPVVPVPVDVVPPGLAVNVHVPEAGKPLKSTLPVLTEQLGCVIVPTIGVVAGDGAAFKSALVDAEEVQPLAFVTVKV